MEKYIKNYESLLVMKEIGRLYNLLFDSINNQHSYEEIGRVSLQLDEVTDEIFSEHISKGNIRSNFNKINQDLHDIYNLCDRFGKNPPKDMRGTVRIFSTLKRTILNVRTAIIEIIKELGVEIQELKI